MKAGKSLLIPAFLAVAGAVGVVLFLQREPSGDGKPMHYWLQRLEGWNRADSDDARAAIRRIGRAGVPWLIKTLQKEDSQFTEGIAFLTNEWKYSARFFHPEPYLRNAAVTALGEIGSPAAAAIPALEQTRRSENFTLACRAEAALLKIRNQPVTPLLLALTNAADFTNWIKAVAIVTEMGSAATAAVPALITALRDPNLQVRTAAATALGQIRDDRAVPPLIAALGDEESSVRNLSLLALGRFRTGANAARPAILQMLHDEDPFMRQDAMTALYRITPPAEADAVRPAISNLLVDPNEFVNRQATQILQRFARSLPANSNDLRTGRRP